jgi:hypothetical protein
MCSSSRLVHGRPFGYGFSIRSPSLMRNTCPFPQRKPRSPKIFFVSASAVPTEWRSSGWRPLPPQTGQHLGRNVFSGIGPPAHNCLVAQESIVSRRAKEQRDISMILQHTAAKSFFLGCALVRGFSFSLHEDCWYHFEHECSLKVFEIDQIPLSGLRIISSA